jgi:WD40 repeat protein/tetratricopeptide (TPR) repeat protein
MAEPTGWKSSARRPQSTDGPDSTDPAREFWGLWRQGQRPVAEEFLARAGISDPVRIVPVLRIDQAERCARGEWVPAEAYLDAFPSVRANRECAIDLVFAEYLLRDERGERPRLEEYQGRFPQYADELKLQVELQAAIQATRTTATSGLESPVTLAIEESTGSEAGPSVYPTIPGYEILGILGRGGMGVVYRAWQGELKRLVAVKMVHAGAMASSQVLARFRVEAEAVARLRHPNIVPIHHVGQHAGAPFLVLELVEGRSLAHRLAGTPQPADWAAATMETLARAIHAAHRQGVVHRDLSPANILLGADGVPRITDFGLAKLLVGGGPMRTQTGDLLGTPSYMAPEQARGRHAEIGAATDVYALGAILYELLTGRPPFKAESPLETVRQVVADEPVAPSRLRPRLTRDLETICLKCLKKEPARRYASAEALADDLRRFLDGRPILARRSTSAEHFWRWCRRNPGLAVANIAAAVLTTLLAIGATLAAWIYRDQLIAIRNSEAQERQARAEAREQLFASLIDRARAGRYSRRAGQRFDSLEALGRAARIGRELRLPPDRLDSLRDEAIACLALPDLKPTGRAIPRPRGTLAAAFDPAMTRYALRFADRVEVRRVADDEEVARFEARGDRELYIFAFSPDGRYLVSTQHPGFALTVWDVERRSVALHDVGRASSARFFPDSRRIGVGHDDGELLVYDPRTGRVGRRWREPGPLQDLAVRPDGTRIAILAHGGAGTDCRIVEAESGGLIRSIRLVSSESVAWSPDGSTLATTGNDSRIYLWDAATGSRKATLEGAINAGLRASFHPAGTLLTSYGWEGRLRLWDAVVGRLVLSMLSFSATEFGRDGRIVGSLDDRFIAYQVDPAPEYRALRNAPEEPKDYHRPSIRRDGRVLAVGTADGAVLWDLAQAGEIAYLPIGNAWHLMFEPSGDLLTSGPMGVWRWPLRLDPGGGESCIGPPRRLALPAGGCAIDRDRSGRIVAKANYDSVSVLTPERKFRVEGLDDCRYVAISPDGEWLATGSHVRGAQVRRVADPARAIDLPIDYRTGVVFSPDSKWLMTVTTPCRLWTVGTWNEARQIGGEGLGFSPDGRLAVVVDSNQAVRLVEAGTGRTLARLEGPDSSRVNMATFSPDGSRLVTTSPEGPAVHVWDLRAIRRHLAGMGLDWEAPAYPDDDPAGPGAPPLPPLQVDLGLLARDREHFVEAPEALIQKYTTRLASHPDDAEAYHHRGHAFATLRRFDEAAGDFTAAIRLRPDDDHFWTSRGEAHQWQQQYDAAIADLEAAMDRKTDDPTVPELLAYCCNNRAWELAKKPGSGNRLERALALCRRALAVAPSEAYYILNTRGVIEYRSCLYAEAVATLEESLAVGRGQFGGFDLYFLAMAHHRLGHRDAARDCLDRAIRWQGEQKGLSTEQVKELVDFRTEAEAVLAGPAGELPDDVFAPPR